MEAARVVDGKLIIDKEKCKQLRALCWKMSIQGSGR